MTKHPYWTLYKADKNGSVYGQDDNKLSPMIHHTGYVIYTIRQYGRQYQTRAHRFIWECLVGEIPKDLVVNHKNGIKRDNRLENLEVVTTKENVIHAFDIGLRKGMPGDTNSMAKLTEVDFMKVVLLIEAGFSNSHIGKRFNLHPNYISLIRHKRRWKEGWNELGR